MQAFWRRLTLVCAALVLSLSTYAQNTDAQPADSLVRLLSAKSMQLIEKDGISYRKVTGPARFLHNETFLLCDTALWNVNTRQIDAIGNVRILQESTSLDSDKLVYLIDRDLAQFRGSVVQLEDKEGNILRTRHLDYNTKDSVAIFKNGASMKDKDGQVIESINGTYDSKAKTFTFTDNVNMFTDSIFVRTTRIVYHTDTDKAEFGTHTDVWKGDDMLSSDSGWYDRPQETFLFHRNVHAMTTDQEAWSDSLYFYRNQMNVEMLGNVQLTDTTRNVTALAGRLEYIDSSSQITLTRAPSVIAVTDSTRLAKDTVYVGGDMLRLSSVMRFQVDSSAVAAAQERKGNMNADVVGAYRAKALAAAREAAEKAKLEDADFMAEQNARKIRENSATPKETPKTEETPSPDEHEEPAMSDSLAVLPSVDTTARLSKPDSTKIGFILGKGNIRLYREDFQMTCDTLKFNELDSLVRLYSNPIVWNEGNRQYAADSIYVSMGENNMDKAYLISNAFVTVEEAKDCYDQIRSAEMLAFFDEKGGLKRFDAMGGVDAVFYLQEDSTFATVNKSQAKLLSATLNDGEIDTVSYFDAPKNNAYPLAQMNSGDRVLKGFNWKPDLRPQGPEDIVRHKLRETSRASYAKRPKAVFRETDHYFPGYMAEVNRQILERRMNEGAVRTEVSADTTISLKTDTVVVRDSLIRKDGPVVARKDSASVRVSAFVKDSVAVADSAVVAEKGLQVNPKLEARAKRKAEREAKWARLDSLDAAKAAVKAEKKAEKERNKKLKAIQQMERQDRKDAARLEKYMIRFEERKNRKSEKTTM